MSTAIRFQHVGAPSVLQPVRVQRPEPGADEVRIEVAAAGVNNADILERRGRYPVPPGAPAGLGLECAGIVAAVGRDVTRWRPGDEVCALVAGGAYAEEVIAPAAQVMPIPDGIDMIQAAALPEVACTVYANLAMLAGVTAGQTVLIHGGAGGIGSFAVQWAAAVGAQVIATVGSQAKVEAASAFGAQTVINYRTQDFVDGTLAATEGRGVDAILDVVGRKYVRRNLECLALDGHLVIIGGSAGPVTVDLWEVMSRRASVSATLLRSRPAWQKAAIVAGVTRDVLPLVQAGDIRPVVDTVFPLEQANLAHELLESGRTVGKVVLETSRHRPPGGTRNPG